MAPVPASHASTEDEDKESFMEHPVYNLPYLESITPWHRPPVDVRACVAVFCGAFRMPPNCTCPSSMCLAHAPLEAGPLLPLVP